MAAPQVIHGGIALIKVQGVVIGKARDVRASESVQRQEVRGIGTIIPTEAPAVQWSGTVSFGFFMIDYNKLTGIPNAIRRDVQSIQEFEDDLVLRQEGVQVDIFKKIEDVRDPITGLIRPKLIPMATIARCLIEGDNMNISDGQMGGRDQSFRYLTPIVFPQ